MQNKILDYLKKYGAQKPEALLDVLELSASEGAGALDKLVREGSLMFTQKGKVVLTSSMGYVAGRLKVYSKGFGFVLVKDGDDVFVSSGDLNGGIDGDIVAVRVKTRGDSGYRREGVVERMVQRSKQPLTGIFEYAKRGGRFIPDNQRIAWVLIPREDINGAPDGFKVVCEITERAKSDTPARGKITEILGSPDDSLTDLKAVLIKHGLELDFPHQALLEARNLPDSVEGPLPEGREDFRDALTITIDGEDSKDLDDAVSLSVKDGKCVLGVHIADVSHFVRKGTALDKEAFNRGTSVYFPGAVVPMLPTELSNGICSLNENADRFTMSCIMTLDANANVVDYRITPGIIKTRYRMTYTACNSMLNGDENTRREYSDIWPMLKQMDELADASRERRRRMGSLTFDVAESKITLNREGRAVAVEKRVQGRAEKIIEQLMLLANETVCTHLNWLDFPCVYRVHGSPDKDKLKDFAVLASEMGFHIKNKNIRSKDLQRLLDEIKDHPAEAVLSRLMVRTMQKAEYSEKNIGHFGLACNYYCHFTSPIRRYPDLIVHRLLRAGLNGIDERTVKYYRNHVKDISESCTSREIAAMSAEREVDDIKKCEYMKDHLGERFTGVISGVVNSGFFVELDNTCEGFVGVAGILGDYYIYDEKRYRFRGDRTGKIFAMGDTVEILVAASDPASRRVDFTLTA